MLNNISLQTLTVFLMSFLQLISIVILARLLSPLIFGQLAAASVVLALATMFSEIGIGSAIVQRKKISLEFINTSLILAAILFFSLSVLIFFSAPYIADYNNDKSLTTVIRYLSIPFVFNGLSSIPKGLLLRNLEYKKLLYVSVIPFLIFINLLATILALYEFGIWSLVIGQILNGVFIFIISMYYSKIKIKPSFNYSNVKDLIHFGGGITLSRFFNYFTVAGDKVILGNTISLDFLGIFERLYKISTLISSQIGTIFDNIIFPIFSRKQDDYKDSIKLYYKTIELSSIIGLILSLTLPLFGYELTLLILGDQWISYSYLLQLLLLLPFTRLLTRVGDAILRSHAMVYQSALVKFFSAVFTLVGLYIASQYEFYWLPIVYFSSSLFTLTVLHIFISYKIKSSLLTFFLIIIKNIFSISIIVFPIWIFIFIFQDNLSSNIMFFVKIIYFTILGYIIFKNPILLGKSFNDTIKLLIK